MQFSGSKGSSERHVYRKKFGGILCWMQNLNVMYRYSLSEFFEEMVDVLGETQE